MFFDTAVESVGNLLGLEGIGEKNEILSFIGIAMGGILIALQALAAYRRAKAMEDAASAQAAASIAQSETNRYIESGQRQERLKNAIEHLGHDSDSVRLGGAYELFHLAEDTKELRQTTLDILCAHIRRTTSEKEYQHNYPSKPSEEIQSLLTLLFVKNYRVFSGCYINLQGSWLNGADLEDARLKNANLKYVRFIHTNLSNAYLERANLFNAKMQASNLTSAKLMNADLSEAKMQVTDFSFTEMQKVKLVKTQMQASYFRETQMQGAFFENTNMRGANFAMSDWDTFETIIATLIDEEPDLSKICFGNMMNTNQIPKGIIRGIYDGEEAEKWIDEYNDAMGVVSIKHQRRLKYPGEPLPP